MFYLLNRQIINYRASSELTVDRPCLCFAFILINSKIINIICSKKVNSHNPALLVNAAADVLGK